MQKFKDEETDGPTDDGQSDIRIAHLNFEFRWAKNCVEKGPLHDNRIQNTHTNT